MTVRTADRVVHLVDQDLAGQHAGVAVDRRVFVVVVEEQPRLDERVAWETARPGVVVELFHRHNVASKPIAQPREVKKGGQRDEVLLVVVNLPGKTLRLRGLDAVEDRHRLVVKREVLVRGVEHEARRCPSVKERAIAEGLTGDVAVPVVTDGEPPGQGAYDWD